jgi:hypothetical protein
MQKMRNNKSKSISEDLMSRFNFINAGYLSIQNLQSSHSLFKHVNIKLYKIIILSAVSFGCETLSLTLREGHNMRVIS